MSYQVLARKWRPKRFPELVGQEHVKNTLINALEMGRLHHAYLFTGTRGVGKTTIARIFAKSLNCEQGIGANPCGQCDTCLSIEQGRYVDLIEIDAASRTKVEDTREILDNVQYAPTRGRYKVYLIDEVHMLSRHSFNALLKTLEEPPAHVKFLLATTDPQKLPITILSRCLQFNLKALSRSEIIGHLEYILQAESVTFEQGTLPLLAKAADGSLRDALSLTDQAIAQSGGGLKLDLVQQMLGTIDKQWSIKLLAHIVNNTPEQALETVDQIAQFMPDYQHLVDQLLSLFHLAAMTQLVPTAAQIDEAMQMFVTRLAAKLSAEDLQLYYQILLNGKRDLELAPDRRMGFEMLMLRLLAFRPLNDIARPCAAALEQNPVKKKVTEDSTQVTLPVPELAVPAKTNDVSQQLATPKVTPLETAPLEAATRPMVTATELNNDDLPAAIELDEATLNAQQESVLLAAEQQGFKPVATGFVASTASVNVTPDVAAPATYQSESPQDHDQLGPEPPPPSEYSGPETADQDDDEAYYSVHDYQPESEAPVISQPSTSVSNDAITATKPTTFEDPVAAILANRNLRLDALFAEKTTNESSPAQATQPQVKAESQTRPQPQIQTETKAAPQHRPNVVSNNPAEPQPVQGNIQGEGGKKSEIEVTESAYQTLPTVDLAPTAPQVPAQPEPLEVAEPVIATPVEIAVPIDTVEIEHSVDANQLQDDLPRWAHEVDEWAALIEKMGLGGLVRLVANQSVWQKQGKQVVLLVHQSEQHLDSPGLREQIQRAMTLALNQVIELELQFTAEILDTPLNIQRRIDADRLARAKNLIYQDPIMVALQQQFAAVIDDQSIIALG